MGDIFPLYKWAVYYQFWPSSHSPKNLPGKGIEGDTRTPRIKMEISGYNSKGIAEMFIQSYSRLLWSSIHKKSRIREIIWFEREWSQFWNNVWENEKRIIFGRSEDIHLIISKCSYKPWIGHILKLKIPSLWFIFIYLLILCSSEHSLWDSSIFSPILVFFPFKFC